MDRHAGTKANPVEGEHTLFGFLTTDANAVVKPVHAKAMPVILTTAEQIEVWMSAPADEALSLQRPAPDETLRIVARGEKKDGGETKAVRYVLSLSGRPRLRAFITVSGDGGWI